MVPTFRSLGLLGHITTAWLLSSSPGHTDPPIEISAVIQTNNGLAVVVQSGLTNRLEIYYAISLTGGPWQVSATGLQVNGSEIVPVPTNAEAGFYVVGNPDVDADNDQLPDSREMFIHLTDPGNNDTDSDSMPDGWEWQFDLSPRDGTDADDDTDLDSWSNSNEYARASSPTNADTDGDGMWDAEDDNPTNTSVYYISSINFTNGTVFYSSDVYIYVALNAEPWAASYTINGMTPFVNDEHCWTNLTLSHGRQNVSIVAYSYSNAVFMTNVSIMVDIEPAAFTVLTPTNRVTEEWIRVVVRADSSNCTGRANGQAFQRNDYLYSTWVQLDPYILTNDVYISMRDVHGRGTSITQEVVCDLPAGYRSNADSDGDGVLNVHDRFPWDPSESSDSDSDGRGDVAEGTSPDPTGPGEWSLGSLIITYPPQGYVEK